MSANRHNRLLSAGMLLVEGVGGPILPEDGQDQNHRRKFMALLLRRIAASLFLPLFDLLSFEEISKSIMILCRNACNILISLSTN